MKVWILILALFVLIAGCTGASLSVENVTGNDTFGLSQGCYSTISGYVKNSGMGAADSATVTCSTEQEGAVFATNSKDIGAVGAGSEVPFSMDVDTDCFKGDVTYKCVVN